MPFVFLLSFANIAVMTAETAEEKIAIWASFANPIIYPVIGVITAAYIFALRYRTGLSRRENLRFGMMVFAGILSSWAMYFLGISLIMGEIVLLQEGWTAIFEPLLTGNLELFMQRVANYEDWFKFFIGIGVMKYFMGGVSNDSVNTRPDKDMLERTIIKLYTRFAPTLLKSNKSYEQFDIELTNSLLSLRNRILSRFGVYL